VNLDKLKEELIRDEGLRMSAYKDSVGLWTIGVGHLLGTTARMTTITLTEAMALLEADIKSATDMARKYIPHLDHLDDVRQRVLVNMAFNLGDRLGQFRRFLTAVLVSDWPSAAVHMMDSKWARQVGQRAVRLRNMILTGMVV